MHQLRTISKDLMSYHNYYMVVFFFFFFVKRILFASLPHKTNTLQELPHKTKTLQELLDMEDK